MFSVCFPFQKITIKHAGLGLYQASIQICPPEVIVTCAYSTYEVSTLTKAQSSTKKSTNMIFLEHNFILK